jgi:PAS domain S-box-containing protein
MPTSLRQDRDRYVAFAFAAADMLLELDLAGRVVVANGAVHAVCGHKPASLAGIRALDLIVDSDQPVVRRAMEGLAGAGRIDPLAIRMKHKDGRQSHVLLGACGLPSVADRRFLTATLLPPAAATAAVTRDPATGLLHQDALLNAALADGGETGLHKRLTFVQLGGLSFSVEQLPQARAHELMAEVGAALRARSAGGDAAARLGGDEFGLIAGRTGGIEHADAFKREIGEAARAVGLFDGLIETRFGSINLAQGGLSDQDAAKALAYAVKRFCDARGGEFTLSSLKDGFVDEVNGVFSRYDDLQRRIAEGRIELVYQPVVHIADRRVHHYEALSRFPDGQSPYEVIRFGEDVGLVEPLDLAVARLAIDVASRTQSTKVAVNLSGRSVQSDSFRKELAALVSPSLHVRDRLMFELTESWAIEQIDEVANFLRWLRRRGHLVCLDDFGSGAAAFNYLRHFEVDFVKIDGPFLKSAVENPRDTVLITSICRLCHSLRFGVIGEMIETEADAEAAAKMGILYGQGWLYGKPLPDLPSSAPATRLDGGIAQKQA